MIDLGVVDDLADNKEPAIFENLAGGIGEIDRPFDAVTKAKLFGQPHRCISYRNHSTGATHFIDNVAAVMRLDLFLHRRHHVGCAQVNLLACRRAAGNKIRAHN